MAYFTEDELIAFAASRGAKVTPGKLKRWRAVKLLPPTVRRGRGRASGIETLYPVEAGPWVVDLVEILAKDRSLKWAGWMLWLKGYPLTHHARGFMADYARRADALFYRLARGDFDKTDPAMRRLRNIPGMRAVANAMSGQSVPLDDVAALNQFAVKAGGESVHLASPHEMPPRFNAWGDILEKVPDATLIAMRGEVLLLRLVLEVILERENVPPTPLLLLLWFGVTRLSPIGAVVANALATGQVPQLIEHYRGDLTAANELFRLLRGASNPD